MRRKTATITGNTKIYLLLVIMFLFLFSIPVNSQTQQFTNGTIITVAGTGQAGYNGDDINATNAQINGAYKVALDSSGNLYIADSGNHRIRKVLTNGTIITVAGYSASCSNPSPACNEGAIATDAQLRNPEGVDVDADGNIFIIDSSGGRIRKVDSSTKRIRTIAGTGYEGYSGDGGPATSAQLDDPSDIAVDSSGNIYIAEYSGGSGVIRKLTPNGQGNYTISTVAGNNTECANRASIVNPCGDNGLATSAQLAPRGVAVDSSGNIYIADGTNYRVRKVSASTGIITTIAGTGDAYNTPLGYGGPATSAKIGDSSDLELDGSGNVYVADSSDNAVKKIDKNTGIITLVAGGGATPQTLGDGGPAINSTLSSPIGLKFDSAGSLYIADFWNHRIRKVINLSPPPPQPTATPSPTTTPSPTATPTPVQSTVTLISPKTLQTTGDITFGCIVSGANITNVSLYTNTSSVWKKEETKPFQDTTVQDFQLTGIKSGSYIWNCESKTSSGALAFSGQNQSFEVKLNIQGQTTQSPLTSPVVCNQLKDCTDWKPDKCPVTKIQTRSCNNTKQCNYAETWSCNYTGPPATTSTSNGTGPDQGTKSSEGLLGLDTTTWIIIVVVIVVAVAVVLLFFMRKKNVEPLYEEEPAEQEYQEDNQRR